MKKVIKLYSFTYLIDFTKCLDLNMMKKLETN